MSKQADRKVLKRKTVQQIQGTSNRDCIQWVTGNKTYIWMLHYTEMRAPILVAYLYSCVIVLCYFVFTYLVWSISSIWAEQFLRNARNCVRHRTKRCACAGFTERETELVWIMNINTLTPLIVIRRYFVFLSNCFIIIFLEINTTYACHFTVIMVRFNKNEKKKI